MSMNTYLQGRMRNTPLPMSHGLHCLFEAVVNSIHSSAEQSTDPAYGEIDVQIIRNPQTSLQLEDSKSKRGAAALENIAGFKIIDNGVGFNDPNMSSFETLDSDYKANQGCRGVGRLLWLKAFQRVEVSSVFMGEGGILKQRAFSFTAALGVDNIQLGDAPVDSQPRTCVHLDGFATPYREKSAKTARTIANSLVEHCLWYFVREGGAPTIRILDDLELICLDDVYDEYMFSSTTKQTVEVKEQIFGLTHIKLKAGSAKQHFIAWCAAGRLVEEETIAGKVPGLYGKINDDTGDFVYACYVTSPFLDHHVRPERIGFDIKEMSDTLFSETDLSLKDIRDMVLGSAGKHLEGYLKENKKAGRERVENYASHKAPRYRPILGRISEDTLNVDPNISDKELETLLHKQLSEIEGSLLSEGHEVMNFG